MVKAPYPMSQPASLKKSHSNLHLQLLYNFELDRAFMSIL